MNTDFSAAALISRGAFRCPCGKAHKAGLKAVCAEDGAIRRLPEFIRRFGGTKPYIIADENTFAAAGSEVISALENAKIPYTLHLYGKERIEPDEAAVGSAVLHFDRKSDCIVSVGSGVLNDIGKIVSGMTGLPYICVGTAPSMDGYASSTSSVIRDRLKVSVDSRCPDAVIADPAILAAAPKKLLLAGLGDMLAKYVSLCEWQIGHLVTGEYYCEEVAAMIRTALERCVAGAKGLLQGDREAAAAVMDGLIVAGIAADYAGVSRPVSGTEHYFSHIWDMRAAALGTPSDLHGIQCAIGTLKTLQGYEALLRIMDKPHRVETFDKAQWLMEMRAYMGEAGGQMLKNAETCALYWGEARSARQKHIAKHKEEIRNIIRTLPASEEIRTLLTDLGAPVTPEDIGIPAEETAICFKATKDIRDKYILSSLAYDLGVLDQLAEQI